MLRLPFHYLAGELMTVEPRHGAGHQFKYLRVAGRWFQLRFDFTSAHPRHAGDGIRINIMKLSLLRHKGHGMHYRQEFPDIVRGVFEGTYPKECAPRHQFHALIFHLSRVAET